MNWQATGKMRMLIPGLNTIGLATLTLTLTLTLIIILRLTQNINLTVAHQ